MADQIICYRKVNGTEFGLSVKCYGETESTVMRGFSYELCLRNNQCGYLVSHPCYSSGLLNVVYKLGIVQGCKISVSKLLGMFEIVMCILFFFIGITSP